MSGEADQIGIDQRLADVHSTGAQDWIRKLPQLPFRTPPCYPPEGGYNKCHASGIFVKHLFVQACHPPIIIGGWHGIKIERRHGIGNKIRQSVPIMFSVAGMMNRYVLLNGVVALLLALPAGSEAQINKCVINGSVTYQSAACPSNEVRRPVTAAELNVERQKKLAQSIAQPASSPLVSRKSPDASKNVGIPRESGSASNDLRQPNQSMPAGTSQYRCDGRTHCSQMTSCKEAEYFLANCPGVKMDGDRNGVPCEQQWCN